MNTSGNSIRVTALSLLFLVSFFNYMDRYMLAVLLPAIKADLQLSDTEIGFITGLAFTLFYATMGIPIARLADRYSRKNIIAIALSVWSAMTALCGVAQNFVQLAVARVLVGVGEAGASPTFRHLSVATGLYTVLWLGVVQWLPSFFTRSFGLETGEVGTWLAIILSVSQLIGMLLGGYLADRLGAADLRWYVWVPSLALLVSTPMFVLTFLTQNPTVAFLSLFLPFMIGVMQGPPSFAVAQGLADVRMRAMAAALLLLITNLIGGGIGPQAVGIMSDYLAAGHQQDSLRYALLAVSLVFGLWSSLHYFLAGKTIRREFRKS